MKHIKKIMTVLMVSCLLQSAQSQADFSSFLNTPLSYLKAKTFEGLVWAGDQFARLPYISPKEEIVAPPAQPTQSSSIVPKLFVIALIGCGIQHYRNPEFFPNTLATCWKSLQQVWGRVMGTEKTKQATAIQASGPSTPQDMQSQSLTTAPTAYVASTYQVPPATNPQGKD